MSVLHRNDRAGELPPSWYAATVHVPEQRAPLKGSVTTDVCIIGAGYTGLVAALELRSRGLDCIVLDAHRAGWGASGRNGGQVGSGHNKSQGWLEKRVGRGTARAMWDVSEAAKDLVRDLAAQHAPLANYKPGVAHGEYRASGITEARIEAELLATHYTYNQITVLDRPEFQDLVRSPLYQGGQIDTGAGHIHPLHFALGLASAAVEAGSELYEGSEVHSITHGPAATVRTGQGQVKARHVILAGNGYLPGIEPKVASRVMPVNSFMGATAPLGPRAKQVLRDDIAVCDSSHVVNYFRLSEDGRLLFGGRANYSQTFPADIGKTLESRMWEMFPQLAGHNFEYTWGGSLGVTMTRLPAVLRVQPNVLSASGYSGHGVALACMAGKVMAEAIAGQADRFDTLAALPTKRLPLGPFMQEPTMALAMMWFQLRDKLGV